MNQFESESTIEERRKQRQEEWEKVRTADQPECESNNDAMAIRLIFNSSNQKKLIFQLLLLVAPEEPYDGRSLYDRLKEQRDAKDLEFEEARKFKNMIRGLDVSSIVLWRYRSHLN